MFREALVVFSLAAGGAAAAADFNGMWDARLNTGAIQVPFRMQVSDSPLRVCFFEGPQPVCSTSATAADDKLTARWDYLNTELVLTARGEGLTGLYRNLRRGAGNLLEAARQLPAAPAPRPSVNVDGTWEIHSAERPQAAAAHLILRQSGADLEGTVLRVDGDDGTLTGRVVGNEFLISHFAGDRPTLLEGKLREDGTLELTLGRNKLIALRPAEARKRHLDPPPDPATYAKARRPEEPFRFSFPDLDGHTVTQAAFSGKPFIASITGSWCPNCRDEAPFLTELYRRYHGQGLELVALCFETADDPQYTPLRAFIRQFGIGYPALLAGDPGKLREAVPQIDNLAAFPTTIYVGRDGRVRAVHTGFPSKGSGEERVRVENETRALVEKMLAEKPERK